MLTVDEYNEYRGKKNFYHNIYLFFRKQERGYYDDRYIQNREYKKWQNLYRPI